MSTSLTTLYEIQITGSSPAVTNLDAYKHRYDMALISVNSAATQTLILTSAATAEDKELTFVKLGAGRVSIKAASTDVIANSASGGSLYNDVAGETYATVVVRPIPSAKKWLIIGGHGTWKV